MKCALCLPFNCFTPLRRLAEEGAILQLPAVYWHFLVILCWRRAAHRYEIITFRGCCELSSRKVFLASSSSAVG